MKVEVLVSFIKIVLQYFLLPVLVAIFSYYFWKYRERRHKNNIHDKKIFDHVNFIVNSQDISEIVHDADMGYLPSNTHRKVDDLYYFNQDFANRFINKKLQKNYMEFDKALAKLSQLYAFSRYTDFSSESRSHFKLIQCKKGNVDHAEDKLITENSELVSRVEKAYAAFRLMIKKRFSE